MGTADEKPWEEEDNHDKDSGLDSLNGSAEEEEDLTQRIVAQIEYYFSDENILRDSFLLKHVRRNREGYVSLKLMASFRKVKSLTKNWELVREALRSSSTRLEVNAEGTKVRRREPLPDHDETAPSRTVVAFPLVDRVTVEAVAEISRVAGPSRCCACCDPADPCRPAPSDSSSDTRKPAAAPPPSSSSSTTRQPVLPCGRPALCCACCRSPCRRRRVCRRWGGTPAAAVEGDGQRSGQAAGGRANRSVRVPGPGGAACSSPRPSSPLLAPRHKSHSQGDVSVAGLWVKKRPDGLGPVLRQPRGPDGTRGFYGRSSACLAPS
ncbi:hypothetical protein HPB51_010229 [Rhipicephalus microplus]|uniref:La-related protein 6 n=1 Tax=Rhipicephalus microplus TaxID=6941 RepID=A0A9J6F1M2_RHIMP|nr:hypothetical protein HPB51_010229 [Rhipicephalus microplus]